MQAFAIVARFVLWFVLIPSMFRRFDRLHAVPVRPKLFGGYNSSVPSDQTLAANGDRRAGAQQFWLATPLPSGRCE